MSHGFRWFERRPEIRTETSSEGDGMTLLLHQSIVVEIGELASWIGEQHLGMGQN